MKKKLMDGCLLAIESSCDDTSAAIIKEGVVLSNIVSSQIDHAEYGGVVPELASRKHILQISLVVEKALEKADISKKELDGIAFARGPGLLGSLIVGVTFAKGMALALNIPLIEVHHMHAHILAHFAEPPYPAFPFLCLTVSGGHTQLVKVSNPLEMKVVGTTIDDAAGEAFDKTGKMLGLAYPAGPIIDKFAQNGTPVYTFTEPKIADYDFSFSGLKTAILYFVRDEMKKDPQFIVDNIDNICASVQYTIVHILLTKMEKAAIELGISELCIAGGVSANSELRKKFTDLGKKRGWNTYIPDFQYCTDNAAMIGIAAQYKFNAGIFVDQGVTPSPRMEF